MKSFFEFYQHIKEFTGVPTPGAPAAPGAGAPAGAPPAAGAPGAAAPAPGAGPANPKEQQFAVDNFAQELKTMMGQTVNLGNFVQKLKQYIGKEEFVKALMTGGPEDKLGVDQNKALSVTDLIPTQSEIFLEKSLDNGLLNKFGNLDKLLTGDPNAVPGAVIVAQVAGGYHILDGHHRWSQYISFNKGGQVNCHVISGLKTALEALKATHLAIASVLKDVPLEEEKGTNILTMDDNSIKSYAVQKIDASGTLPVFQQSVTSQPMNSSDDAGNYIVGNTQTMKAQAGKATSKEERNVMPQTGKAKGFDSALSAGQVNVKFDHLVLAGVLTIEQYYAMPIKKKK
jgi:hypothetical protein